MNLPVIYSPEHKKHNPEFEIYDGVKEKYVEKPERIESIVEALRAEGLREFILPKSFTRDHIEKMHHFAYIHYLERRCEKIPAEGILYPSFFITDTYAPVVKQTFHVAVQSVNIALTGAEKVRDGEKLVYSLCRPPGHHAERSSMGGYCYFNNAAIAADFLSEKGKVAILDIDFHHGNGTQAVFYERSDVLYVSVHADPMRRYPYKTGFADERGKDAGEGFNKNYPLPIGTSDKDYLPVLRSAIGDVEKFAPDFLVVSLGFDAYEKDPIGGFLLSIPFYETIGQEIKKLNYPTLLVQEGGYNVEDLGKMAVNFLKGIAS